MVKRRARHEIEKTEMINETFKKESLKEVVAAVAQELSCSLIDACTKMQAQCVRSNNEEILEELCAYKWELIAA